MVSQLPLNGHTHHVRVEYLCTHRPAGVADAQSDDVAKQMVSG